MSTFSDQLQQLRRNQQLLYVLLFSLVTVVIWVGVGLFSSQRSSRIDPYLLTIARPLNPNINEEIITEIEGKRHYSQAELSEFTIFKLLKTQDGKQQQLVNIETSLEDIFVPQQEALLNEESQATDSASLPDNEPPSATTSAVTESTTE